MKTLVLFDTNFFFLPHRYKIDVFNEIGSLVPEAHELATLSTVVSELEKLGLSGGEDGVAARVALELLRRNSLRVIPAEGSADESIIKYAAENRGNVIVCTNDLGLKRALVKVGVPLVVLRGKNHISRL